MKTDENRRVNLIYALTAFSMLISFPLIGEYTTFERLLIILKLPTIIAYKNSVIFINGIFAVLSIATLWLSIVLTVKPKTAKARYYYPVYFVSIIFVAALIWRK